MVEINRTSTPTEQASMSLRCGRTKLRGYCQGHRITVIEQLRKSGSLAKIPSKTETDCSSLVRACCIQAGFDPGNFNTSAEVSALKASKRFMEPITVKSGTKLCNGDILVTKTKGHTVVVISGNPRQAVSHYPKYKGASGSIITALHSRLPRYRI